MKSKRRAKGILAVLTCLFCTAAVYSVEYYDHPQIGRYEGSSVVHQESSSFNEYTVGLGAAKDGQVAETLKVEGQVLMTLYSGPEDASSFEIISAYRKLLQSKGFEVLFACEKAECGEKFLAAFANDPGWNNSSPITQGNPDVSCVLAGKISSAPGPLRYRIPLRLLKGGGMNSTCSTTERRST